MSDLAFLSASELVAKIKTKEISALELLEHFWARKQRLDPALNSIIFDQIEKAREKAKEAFVIYSTDSK